MRIVLRVRATKAIIKERTVLSEITLKEAREYLTKEMDGWERSDQFIGRALEIATIPSFPGEKLV